jgi:hypothetical protein
MLGGFKSGIVGGHLTDLKIWLTAMSGMIQMPIWKSRFIQLQ